MQRTAQFDTALMQHDMAARGWQPADLADRAQVARSTVSRFLSGELQTARTAKKLATALGHSLRRYLAAMEQAS